MDHELVRRWTALNDELALVTSSLDTADLTMLERQMIRERCTVLWQRREALLEEIRKEVQDAAGNRHVPHR